jgi:hypothetical protein
MICNPEGSQVNGIEKCLLSRDCEQKLHGDRIQQHATLPFVCAVCAVIAYQKGPQASYHPQ